MTYYKARQSHTDAYTNSNTDMIWVLTEELQSFKHLKVVDLPRIHTTNIMNNEWVLASTPVTVAFPSVQNLEVLMIMPQ